MERTMLTLTDIKNHICKCKSLRIDYNWETFIGDTDITQDVQNLFMIGRKFDWAGNSKLRELEIFTK
jgi:hypothetical protein